MKIYYIEYKNTVKFFNEDKTLELIRNDIFLKRFLKAVYKKYGRSIKFLDLMEK